VGQFSVSGIVNVLPSEPVQVFAEAVGMERFPKSTSSARRSGVAALKRIIVSSRMGISWVKVTLFPPDPRRGQIGISL
jgi:hypothetical protein